MQGRAWGQLRWGNVTQEKQAESLRLTAVSQEGNPGPPFDLMTCKKTVSSGKSLGQNKVVITVEFLAIFFFFLSLSSFRIRTAFYLTYKNLML